MTRDGYQRRREARNRARRSKVIHELLLYLVITAVAFGSLLIASEVKAKSQLQTVERDYFRIVKVKEGDSLWRIAEEHAPQNCDYRLYVSRLVDINKLSSANIYVGQKILVPAEDTPPAAPPREVRENLACLSSNARN